MTTKLSEYNRLYARYEASLKWVIKQRKEFDKAIVIPMDEIWKSMSPEEQQEWHDQNPGRVRGTWNF